MNQKEFQEFVQNKIIYLDGATGTNLQKAGMPVGVCPEEWILNHKQVMLELQKAYVDAGTTILYAPTFTGNRIKLKEYGLENKLAFIKRSSRRKSFGGRGYYDDGGAVVSHWHINV